MNTTTNHKPHDSLPSDRTQPSAAHTLTNDQRCWLPACEQTPHHQPNPVGNIPPHRAATNDCYHPYPHGGVKRCRPIGCYPRGRQKNLPAALRRAMATTTDRGYGYVHQRLRRHWEREIALGDVFCARCSRLIVPGSFWDLGHDDFDRSAPTHREHRSCNRGAAAVKGNKSRAVRVRYTSREW
jgi:hypothetical protein